MRRHIHLHHHKHIHRRFIHKHLQHKGPVNISHLLGHRRIHGEGRKANSYFEKKGCGVSHHSRQHNRPLHFKTLF